MFIQKSRSTKFMQMSSARSNCQEKTRSKVEKKTKKKRQKEGIGRKSGILFLLIFILGVKKAKRNIYNKNEFNPIQDKINKTKRDKRKKEKENTYEF